MQKPGLKNWLILAIEALILPAFVLIALPV
jgi:hypothetical protein